MSTFLKDGLRLSPPAVSGVLERGVEVSDAWSDSTSLTAVFLARLCSAEDRRRLLRSFNGDDSQKAQLVEAMERLQEQEESELTRMVFPPMPSTQPHSSSEPRPSLDVERAIAWCTQQAEEAATTADNAESLETCTSGQVHRDTNEQAVAFVPSAAPESEPPVSSSPAPPTDAKESQMSPSSSQAQASDTAVALASPTSSEATEACAQSPDAMMALTSQSASEATAEPSRPPSPPPASAVESPFAHMQPPSALLPAALLASGPAIAASAAVAAHAKSAQDSQSKDSSMRPEEGNKNNRFSLCTLEEPPPYLQSSRRPSSKSNSGNTGQSNIPGGDGGMVEVDHTGQSSSSRSSSSYGGDIGQSNIPGNSGGMVEVDHTGHSSSSSSSSSSTTDSHVYSPLRSSTTAGSDPATSQNAGQQDQSSPVQDQQADMSESTQELTELPDQKPEPAGQESSSTATAGQRGGSMHVRRTEKFDPLAPMLDRHQTLTAYAIDLERQLHALKLRLEDEPAAGPPQEDPACDTEVEASSEAVVHAEAQDKAEEQGSVAEISIQVCEGGAKQEEQPKGRGSQAREERVEQEGQQRSGELRESQNFSFKRTSAPEASVEAGDATADLSPAAGSPFLRIRVEGAGRPESQMLSHQVSEASSPTKHSETTTPRSDSKVAALQQLVRQLTALKSEVALRKAGSPLASPTHHGLEASATTLPSYQSKNRLGLPSGLRPASQSTRPRSSNLASGRNEGKEEVAASPAAPPTSPQATRLAELKVKALQILTAMDHQARGPKPNGNALFHVSQHTLQHPASAAKGASAMAQQAATSPKDMSDIKAQAYKLLTTFEFGRYQQQQPLAVPSSPAAPTHTQPLMHTTSMPNNVQQLPLSSPSPASSQQPASFHHQPPALSAQMPPSVAPPAPNTHQLAASPNNGTSSTSNGMVSPKAQAAARLEELQAKAAKLMASRSMPHSMSVRSSAPGVPNPATAYHSPSMHAIPALSESSLQPPAPNHAAGASTLRQSALQLLASSSTTLDSPALAASPTHPSRHYKQGSTSSAAVSGMPLAWDQAEIEGSRRAWSSKDI